MHCLEQTNIRSERYAGHKANELERFSNKIHRWFFDKRWPVPLDCVSR